MGNGQASPLLMVVLYSTTMGSKRQVI